MNDVNDSRLIGMLRRVIRDCHKLYHHGGQWMVRRHPTRLDCCPEHFLELMEDLHRGLLIKVYVTMVRADERWSAPEKRVASAMIEHLWGEKLHGAPLREAATGLFHHADQLSWESLLAPWVRYEPLADSKAQVETVVMRLANLIAKCDGQTMPEEAVALHTMQRQIDMALHPAHPEKTLAPLDDLPGAAQRSRQARTGSRATAEQHQSAAADGADRAAAEVTDPRSREERLAAAMDELDQLVGLHAVKQRVRSYANFLKLQKQRQDAGLPTMPISLHMTFVGNPGTGKTTVARIIGQILGAMGTLQNGHVVETDRSGLVAEYAGQTGTKTNALCDSARGGVLFIDEAYSLVDASGDDAYGREAVQTLLKRMEDDRAELAVILAGYNREMEQMIRSNPGLSSRINTQIEFEDYSPADLGRIFELMCRQNHYQLPATARHRLLIGFDYLYERRDRHFGNGRLVRNAFENTVRHLADRIAEETELTESLLTRLGAEDIDVPGLPRSELDRLTEQPHRLQIVCPGCDKKVRIAPTSLGRRVRCRGCQTVQSASWADVVHR